MRAGLLHVCLVSRGDIRPGDLDRFTMVHIHLYRDQFGEGRHRADVIAVKMGRHQNIDLLQPCLLRSVKNAFRIAVVRCAIRGIDEQRFAHWE